ncbi:MAG: T9SS type A sorting domain-containing protein [Fluviicola sp.]|nr:T9SS type A sorting domain-containing protein [Fluviicola sp.]
MKRTLLLATLAFSFLGNAQSLTSANEPTIGETSNMYLCDSFTVNYAGITGSGVTWDYSNLVGITGQTRLVSVLDATTAPNAADFPTSVKAISVESSMTSYFTSTAADRTSQGFVFNEATLGDIVASFSTDNEVVVTYPFALGSTSTDLFAGTVSYVLGVPTTSPMTGNVYSTIDGQGTMLFPSAVTVPNVIRYNIIDTSVATGTALGDLEIIRNQYEYYSNTTNLPIFTITKLTIQTVGGGTVINEFSLVLSAYVTTNFLSIAEKEEVKFTVYPNPAENEIKINGEFSPNAVGQIIDQSGREVSNFKVINNAPIDISSLENGMYILRITDDNRATSKNIVKR